MVQNLVVNFKERTETEGVREKGEYLVLRKRKWQGGLLKLHNAELHELYE
jgi:hypothetical protein